MSEAAAAAPCSRVGTLNMSRRRGFAEIPRLCIKHFGQPGAAQFVCDRGGGRTCLCLGRKNLSVSLGSDRTEDRDTKDTRCKTGRMGHK